MININFIDDDYTDEKAEIIHEWLDEVGDEFQKSTYFENLQPVENESCFFLLRIFFEYSYSYCLVGPGKLNKDVIDEMMLDVMPRKISADLPTFEAFAPVMENFLCWCEENHYMKDTKKLREHIHKRAPEMIARSQDPGYWGMAKSFMMGSLPKVDLNNFESGNMEGNRWVKSEPSRRGHEKIGRNDACSCGSGKKYKKCCLLATHT